MSERTDEREAVREADADARLDGDFGVDVDALTADPGTASGDRADASRGRPAETVEDESRTTRTGGIRRRLGGLVRNPLRVPSLPSPRSFGISLAVTVVFMLVVGAIVPLPASGLLGVFAGGFALGALSARRRYLELVVAGAIAAGVSLVAGSLTLAALAGLAVPLAAFGAGGGALAALLGHYFGRDLRDGLTREI